MYGTGTAKRKQGEFLRVDAALGPENAYFISHPHINDPADARGGFERAHAEWFSDLFFEGAFRRVHVERLRTAEEVVWV